MCFFPGCTGLLSVFFAACGMRRSAVSPASHTQCTVLDFENLLEVRDWVHTLRRQTSCSHYPVREVMRNSFSNYSLGSCLLAGLKHTHTRVFVTFMAFSDLMENCFYLIKSLLHVRIGRGHCCVHKKHPDSTPFKEAVMFAKAINQVRSGVIL